MITTKSIATAREFIARWEGWSPTPYRCSANKLTIGYGHVILDGENYERLSPEEGKILLEADMAEAIDCVDTNVDVDINDNQAAALVSFVFNVGCGAFRGSTLLKLLNSGNYDLAALQFKRWNKAGGQVVQGLVNRRKAEAELFLT